MVVNNLYYDNRQSSDSFDFSDEVLARALENIYYRDFDTSGAVEPNLYQEILSALNSAVDSGVKLSPAPDPDVDFINALRHSAEVFSAFKVHRFQNDMARAMIGSDGNLKPFEQWSKDIRPIASHQVGAWLKTEYDTAVIRAHQAADWNQFMRDKDVLPNLKWMPSTSAVPGEDHRVFWGVIRPVDDPFWAHHRPGDRWNCKCSLSSTDEPVTAAPGAATPLDNPQPGLRSNPGTDRQLFSDDHPYFPDSCSSCPFAPGFSASRLFAAKRKKDCFSCKHVDSRLKAVSDKRKAAKRDYLELANNQLYRDVRFDKRSNGLIAIHVGHNTDSGKKIFFNNTMSPAELEMECAEQLFRYGHKVILCDESKERIPGEKYPALDMMLDDRIMELKSITGRGWYWNALVKKNKQIKNYNARPDIDTPADAICLYFHKASMFNPDNLRRSINRYKHFYDNNGNYVNPLIKRIYVVLNGQEEIKQYDL